MANAARRVNEWVPRALPTRREGLIGLLGLAWGIGAAWWIVQEQWVALTLWLSMPPLLLIVARVPFSAVLVWILFAPLFARAYSADMRWLNWLFGRLLLPTALALSVWSLGQRKTRAPRGLAIAEFASVLFGAGVCLLIGLANPNPIGDLISFYDLLFVPLCAYWVLRLNSVSAHEWHWLVVVCAGAFLFQLVVGALAWAIPAVLPVEWLGLYGERTVGTLGQPAIYTGALTLFAVILFFAASRSAGRMVRVLSVIVLVLALVVTLWSFSRASWLATLVVGILFGLYYVRTYKRALLVGAVLMVLAGGVFLVQNGEWTWTRLTDAKRAEERLIDEITSLRMIAVRPVLGWGFMRHNESRAEFATPLFSGRVVPELVSHNTYLTLLADLGIPLFILYMTPALWWLWRTWQARRQLSDARFTLVLLLWLALVHLFVVSSFVDVVSWHPVGTTLWWLTLGLIANRVSQNATI